jgi:hypothetical protein
MQISEKSIRSHASQLQRIVIHRKCILRVGQTWKPKYSRRAISCRKGVRIPCRPFNPVFLRRDETFPIFSMIFFFHLHDMKVSFSGISLNCTLYYYYGKTSSWISQSSSCLFLFTYSN